MLSSSTCWDKTRYENASSFNISVKGTDHTNPPKGK